MPRRRLPTVLVLLAGMTLGSCTWWYQDVPSPDDLMYRVPWFDHMLGSRAIHPYETADVPRTTPPGTVPITGGEVDWYDEWRVLNTTTADGLVNPLGLADGLARGDTLYQTFCSMCHGAEGRGDGLVGRKMGAPSLMTPRAAAFSDGYIYSIIRYGRGIMGQYGDKIYHTDDRWRVVSYVRRLQAGADGGTD